jgi:hypothetical protein
MSDISLIRGIPMIKMFRHNLTDIKNSAIIKKIKSALIDGELTEQDLYRKIVFNSLCEGHGPTEMQAVLDSLSQESWYDLSRIVFLHNVVDQIPQHIKNISWSWYMTNHSNWLYNLQRIKFDWQSHIKDRWVLCLMRRRSKQRSALLKNLLSSFDPAHYRVSYASMINYQDFDDIAQVQIPILLDGPTPGDEQHNAHDPGIFNCLINLIAETSCQEPGNDFWSSTFITEKTFKCFGWRQIPIWFASPGHVQAVRSLGFDVFDDIIDHSVYDSITNPGDRMLAVIGALKTFLDKHSGIAPNDFYQQTKHRIEQNWERLLELDRQRLSHWNTVMENIHEL